VAIRYFIGRSQAWLEAELFKAQEELAAGNTVMTVTTGDTQTGAQVQVNIKERIEMILKELNILDDETYPSSAIVRTTRTTPQYQNG
jgi:hypothetical protein